MPPMAEAAPTSPGELLRFWRHRRRMSQLDLASTAAVSTKHLSFVETGRARPSRQLLVHLADVLAIPLRERNRLLLAAGFAPPHRERPFHDHAMRPLRQAVDGLLAAHEPNPALVVNAHWELVAANRAAHVLFDGVAPALRTPPVNLLRLFTHPDGLPRILMSMRASPKRHELMAQDQCCGSARDALDGRVSSTMPSIDTNVDSMSLRMIRSR